MDLKKLGHVSKEEMNERLCRKRKTITRMLRVQFPYLLEALYSSSSNGSESSIGGEDKGTSLDIFDGNGDDTIDRDEFLRGVQQIHQRVQDRKEKVHALTMLFNTMDLDGGGTLTKEEIEVCLKKSLVVVRDENSSYSIQASLSRFPFLLSCFHPRNFHNSMRTLDADGDGIITLDEFVAWVDAVEIDAKERAKYVPPLENVLFLEESSVEALWRIWKVHFLTGDGNEDGQLIRLVLHKLHRDHAFKQKIKQAIPLDVYESIRTMLLEVLIPPKWSRFRKQKRFEMGKLTLYDFIVSVDGAMRKRKERKRKDAARKKMLPVL